MLEYLPYIWVAVAVLGVICEALTSALVSIWFIPAALVSMVLAFCGVAEWIQILVFFLVAFVLLAFCRTIFRRFLGAKPVPTNADALIGRQAIVTETIDNLRQTGAARLEGKEWTARSDENGRVLLAGELVTVERIEGVKLICK